MVLIHMFPGIQLLPMMTLMMMMATMMMTMTTMMVVDDDMLVMTLMVMVMMMKTVMLIMKMIMIWGRNDGRLIMNESELKKIIIMHIFFVFPFEQCTTPKGEVHCDVNK